MINKMMNVVILTLTLLVVMAVHPKEFIWWHYVVAAFVLPNASFVIWLTIEWFKFNCKEFEES